MDHKYTVTIQGPEGTEIWEGDGLLMFLQKPTDTGCNTQVIGYHVDESQLPGTMAKSPDLLPAAFAACGLAIGKRLAPTPSPLAEILKGALSRAMKDEDEEDEDDEE